MAIVSSQDIYGEKKLQEMKDSPFHGSSLTQQRAVHIKHLIKVILTAGVLLIEQNSFSSYKITGFGYIESSGELGKEVFQDESFNIDKPKSDPIPENNEPIIDVMPDFTVQEGNERNSYIHHFRRNFSTLNWKDRNYQTQTYQQQNDNFVLMSKAGSLSNFYRDNRRIIDNMARFSGGGKLDDVCGSAILVPWILYTSSTVKEAWENIHQLTQINYKHGKNWSIILEVLVNEGIAEKINPLDLLIKTIPEGTILTYDGTQSSGAGKIYGHVEMTLAESSLDDGHFYYGNENTRAGGSASPRINLKIAIKLLERGIGLLGRSDDMKKMKGSLGGLIGAYKIKSGVTPKKLIATLVNIDISSKEKDIPMIALLNYSMNK